MPLHSKLKQKFVVKPHTQPQFLWAADDTELFLVKCFLLFETFLAQSKWYVYFILTQAPNVSLMFG